MVLVWEQTARTNEPAVDPASPALEDHLDPDGLIDTLLVTGGCQGGAEVGLFNDFELGAWAAPNVQPLLDVLDHDEAGRPRWLRLFSTAPHRLRAPRWACDRSSRGAGVRVGVAVADASSAALIRSEYVQAPTTSAKATRALKQRASFIAIYRPFRAPSERGRPRTASTKGVGSCRCSGRSSRATE